MSIATSDSINLEELNNWRKDQYINEDWLLKNGFEKGIDFNCNGILDLDYFSCGNLYLERINDKDGVRCGLLVAKFNEDNNRFYHEVYLIHIYPNGMTKQELSLMNIALNNKR